MSAMSILQMFLVVLRDFSEGALLSGLILLDYCGILRIRLLGYITGHSLLLPKYFIWYFFGLLAIHIFQNS